MQALILKQREIELKLGWISNRVADLIELAANGGECPQCGTEWELVKVNNRFADFHYFDPVCKCYPRCPDCDTSLHEKWEQHKSVECSCGYGKRSTAPAG